MIFSDQKEYVCDPMLDQHYNRVEQHSFDTRQEILRCAAITYEYICANIIPNILKK